MSADKSELHSLSEDESNSESSSDLWISECETSSDSSRNHNSTSSDASVLSDCSVETKLLSKATKINRKQLAKTNQSDQSFLGRIQSEFKLNNHKFRIGGHINSSPDEQCQCFHCAILNTRDDAFKDNIESLDAVYISWMDNDNIFYDMQNKNMFSTSGSDTGESPSTSNFNDSKDCVVEIEEHFLSRDIQSRFEDDLIKASSERNGIYETTRTSILSFGQALICIWRCMTRKLFPTSDEIKAVIICADTPNHIHFKNIPSSSQENHNNAIDTSDVNENTDQVVTVMHKEG